MTLPWLPLAAQGLAALALVVVGIAIGWWLKARAAAERLAAREAEWSRRDDAHRAAANEAWVGSARRGEELVALRDELEATRGRVNRLGIELEAQVRAVDQTREQRDFFEVDLSRVKLAAARSVERVEALAPLAARVPVLELEVRALRSEAVESMARAAAESRARRRVEAERDRLAEEVRSLGGQLAQAGQVARQEFERHGAEAESWRMERVRLAADLASALEREEEALARLERARAESTVQAGRSREAELAHQAKVAELEAANGALRAQVSRLEPLRRQLEDREQLIRAVALERDASEAERGRREREHESRMARLEAQLAEAGRQVRAAQGIEVKLRRTETNLALVSRERDRLVAALQLKSTELETLRSEARDRDQRFRELSAEYRTTVAARDQELTGLRAHLEGLEAQLHERVVSAVQDRSRDDLQVIRGIGPALERVLNDEGIYLYRQIATWSADDVARIAERLRAFPDRILRDDWVGSARRAHLTKYGEEP
jgi:predicted flap endonuclease-1-like 5' DNA nuclease